MIAPLPWTTERITTDVTSAVRIISGVSGVKKLWFFGSAAQHQTLDVASDLDFAVEGLAHDRYFAVLGELLMALEYPVDLVRWEDATDLMRARIASTGTLLYAA